MNENNPDDVLAAFELLLEAVEIEIDLIDNAGARAFERHDHLAAGEIAERGNQTTAFREKVLSLCNEWSILAKKSTEHLAEIHIENKEEILHSTRRNLSQVQRGVRTPEPTYYQPILEALDNAGGSARMSDVLSKVEQLMRGKLKEVDYEPLPSDGIPRWTKTAQWARWSMVKEGLLKKDSPRGIWEITDVGRKTLIRGNS